MNHQRRTASVSEPEEIQSSQQNTGRSNSDQLAKMNDSNSRPKTLWGTMTHIVNGSLQQAKQDAHAVANAGREAQDQETTALAGELWTLAHLFQDIQHHVSTSNFSVVQSQASSAAQRTKKIVGSVPALQVLGDKLIAATRGYIKKAEQAASASQDTASSETMAQPVVEEAQEEIPTKEPQQSSQLSAIFVLIANGHLSQARAQAHETANQARAQQDSKSAEVAGQIWTIAQTYTEIQGLLKDRKYAPVKDKAKNSADQTRALIAAGHISNEIGDKVLKIAGGYWTIAEKMLIEQSPSKNAPEGSAAANAQNSETIDQHRLNHPNNRAYCGVATLMMLFEANGQDANNTQEMNRIASQIYINRKGSDTDLMGQLMRKRGFDSAVATREGGMDALLDTLDKGQPVPFGVTHSKGTIIKLNSGGSKRYPGSRVGDFHARTFGIAGHWVLVTGYEGSRENPTHFIVNDPDLGGQLRITRAALTRMGVREGQFYQITQQRDQ